MCLAVPGRVTEVSERDGTRMAKVDFGGVLKDVCLAYLPEIEVGDYTIVHVGFAIQRLDEESALETLKTFNELGMLDEEFGDAWGRAAEEAGESRPVGTETGTAPAPAGGAAASPAGETAGPTATATETAQAHS